MQLPLDLNFLKFDQQLFSSQHQTVVACVNAEGQFLPHTIIYTSCIPTDRYSDNFHNHGNVNF